MANLPAGDERPPPGSGLNGGSRLDPARAVLGVFGKHWTPGQTKTRLARTLGESLAAEVSKQFLDTTLRRLALFESPDTGCRLAYSPPGRRAEFEALLSGMGGGWRARPQSEGDLGARMRSFFVDALSDADAAVLVGSDSPHLPLDAVAEAFDWLREPGARRRFVLGPTTDGGYWLIGAAGQLPPVFDGMPWSDPALVELTLARLSDAGWKEGTDYRLLTGWYDVDDADDLAQLRTELPGGDAELVRLAASLDQLLGR